MPIKIADWRQKMKVAGRKTNLNIPEILLIIGIIIASTVVLLLVITEQIRQNGHKEQDRLHSIVSSEISHIEWRIATRTAQLLSTAQLLTKVGTVNRDMFYHLIAPIYDSDSLIKSISYIDGYKMKYTYPEKFRSMQEGHDFSKDGAGFTRFLSTIKKDKLSIIKPVRSVEGGRTFVFRFPVYKMHGNKPKTYSGAVDMTFDARIFQNIIFSDLKNTQEYIYGVREADTHNAIFGDQSVFSMFHHSGKIMISGIQWEIGISPLDFKRLHAGMLLVDILVYLFAVCSLITFVLLYANIKHSDRRMKQMLASMNDFIAEIDASGKFRNVEKTDYHFVEHLPEEYIGKNIDYIISEQYLDEFRKVAKECKTTKKQVSFDLYSEKFGKWFMVLLGYIDSHVLLLKITDINERVRTIEKLTEAEKQLKSLIADKDKFLSIIAHDLRNPIIAQKSALETLSSQYEGFSEADRREFINLLNESAQTLYALLENLLMWSRINCGKIVYTPQNTDLVKIINNSVSANVTNAKNKMITIRKEIPAALPCVVDGNMMTTVIRNIISNSVKFTPEGGNITVSAEILSDKSLRIEIADTGVGMSDEVIGKLFKIGSSVTSRGTNNEVGTGLGLILCKEFVDKHSGTLNVESEIGHGSKFIITIPQNSSL